MRVVTEKLSPVKPTRIEPESAPRARVIPVKCIVRSSCIVAIAPVSEIGIQIGVNAAGAR